MKIEITKEMIDVAFKADRKFGVLNQSVDWVEYISYLYEKMSAIDPQIKNLEKELLNVTLNSIKSKLEARDKIKALNNPWKKISELVLDDNKDHENFIIRWKISDKYYAYNMVYFTYSQQYVNFLTGGKMDIAEFLIDECDSEFAPIPGVTS